MRRMLACLIAGPVAAGCGCSGSGLGGAPGDGETDTHAWDAPDAIDPGLPDPGAPDVEIWYPDAWDAADAPPPPGCEGVGADLVVPTAYESIQIAIVSTSPGETVCVEPGIYHEHLEIDGRQIRVIGAAGPYLTIVDADFWGTVLTFSGVGPETVFQGFTLRHGYGAFGGGIKVGDASPRIVNVHVVDNLNFGFGGGINIERGSPSFENVVVAGNVTEDGFGGGMVIMGPGSPSFRNVVFAWNETWSGFGGGISIMVDDASITMQNVIFAGNIDQSGFGGGIHASGGSLTVTNSTFYANEVHSGSGGALDVDSPMALVRLVNVDVTGNTADSLGGGAIFVEPGSSTSLSHCNIWDNGVSGIPDPVGTDGNVSSDPLYLYPGGDVPLDWDLHLGAGSGLVDAGDPAIRDADGGPSDIGAYGGPGGALWDLDGDGFPAWWQPGPYDRSAYPAMGLDCNDSNPLLYPGSGC